MFFLEFAVLILAVIFLMTRGLWIEYSANRNEQRQKAACERLLHPMLGQPIAGAIRRFGQPAEYVAGTTGRGLYIWISPPAKRFPPGRGVLVVTLTADAEGTITDAAWSARAT